MKLFRKRILKLGNKGLSMVELICGITILAIIGTSISSMLIVSANSYDRGSAEAEVQQEAQLVANQISDLLIDATADVTYSGNVLTITQGTDVYTVTYKSGEQKLYYAENGGTSQLMAEGLESFSVDVTDFPEHGYARLNMKFKNDAQEYPAVFTITARNKEVSEATEVVASIALPANIYTEPLYAFELNATCYGMANPDVDWELIGAKSSGEVIDNNSSAIVKLGADEDANMVRVRAYVEKDGVLLAENYVNVYVRRVTGMAINLEGRNGAEFASGTKYTFKATADGTNLNNAGSLEAGGFYKSPYGVDWSIEEGNAYATITSLAGDNTRATLTLTQAMTPGVPVVIKATAKHPDGDNKSGEDYGDVSETYTLILNDPYIEPDGGWMRRTDEAQATISGAITSLKQTLEDADGDGVKENIPVHKVEIMYREYPDGTYDGIWLPNLYGDANNSMTVNLRPLFTAVLDYDKDYEIMIKLVIENQNGDVLWPVAGETPEELYLTKGIMSRVLVGFTSPIAEMNMTETTVKRTEAEADANPLTMRKGDISTLISFSMVQGIEADDMWNQLGFILEKKNDSGTWDYVTSTIDHGLDKVDGYAIQNSGGSCTFKYDYDDDFSGSYRIKVEAIQPNEELEMKANGTYDIKTVGQEIWSLYENEPAGSEEGIFYFDVIKQP